MLHTIFNFQTLDTFFGKKDPNTMWNADSPTGETQKKGWQSGLKFIKLKVPISEYLDETVYEHLLDNHNDWCEEHDGGDVETDGEVYIYVNINTVTGEISVVGVDGHPVDTTKKFK